MCPTALTRAGEAPVVDPAAPSVEVSAPPLTAGMLVVGETTAGALYGLMEVLNSVGVAWASLTGERHAVRQVAATPVSLPGGTFVTDAGVPVMTSALDDTGQMDVVVVTDLELGRATDFRDRWPAEGAWLCRQLEGGATVCSVCTGSVLLAEAGLLDGLEATTHWGVAPLFAEHYPRVRLRAERILCPAGPEHRIVTSGGSASWTDLALYLVARFCGTAEAVRLAKVFLIGDHSEGQLPFAARPRHRYHEDAVIDASQLWIAEHYAEPNPVARMVERSGLSERTFKRRFKAATGYTPVEYVQVLRLEEAKQMLEAGHAAVDDIAWQVGYQDPASFRRLFKRRTGITPSRYRQRFRQLVAPPSG